MEFCLKYTVNPEPYIIKTGNKERKIFVKNRLKMDMASAFYCDCKCEKIDERGVCLNCNHLSIKHLSIYHNWERQQMRKAP